MGHLLARRILGQIPNPRGPFSIPRMSSCCASGASGPEVGTDGPAGGAEDSASNVGRVTPRFFATPLYNADGSGDLNGQNLQHELGFAPGGFMCDGPLKIGKSFDYIGDELLLKEIQGANVEAAEAKKARKQIVYPEFEDINYSDQPCRNDFAPSWGEIDVGQFFENEAALLWGYSSGGDSESRDEAGVDTNGEDDSQEPSAPAFQPPADLPQVAPPRNRRRQGAHNRAANACISCHTSKTKCRGGFPCKRCIRLNKAHTCQPYIASEEIKAKRKRKREQNRGKTALSDAVNPFPNLPCNKNPEWCVRKYRHTGHCTDKTKRARRRRRS